MKLYHFDFTVDIHDVDTIFTCLQQEIVHMMELKIDEKSGENRQSYIDWYDERIKYIEELKTKLTHTIVEE